MIDSKLINILSKEDKHKLQNIWKPKIGDRYFLRNMLPPFPKLLSVETKEFLTNNRKIAYPLFEINQMIDIIENYKGFIKVKELTSLANSSTDLEKMLWEEIVNILKEI